MGNAQSSSLVQDVLQLLQVSSLRDKVVIITGCNRGLGKEAARGFVAHGAKVIMACRDEQMCNEVIAEFQETYSLEPDAIRFIPLDLQSFNSIEQFVETFLQLKLPLHILINNAGIFALPTYQTTSYKVERQFAVNYLGHFLLTMRLLPILLENPQSRVVCVSSRLHADIASYYEFNISRLPPLESDYNPWKNYGLSKAAMIMFMRFLNDHYHHRGLIACSVHPGIIQTNITRHNSVAKLILQIAPTSLITTLEEGAASIIFCALSPRVEGGGYYTHSQKIEPSADAKNSHFGILLYRLSERILISQKTYLTPFNPSFYEKCFERVKQVSFDPVSKQTWESDEQIFSCPLCFTPFTSIFRKHHCRFCGRVVCELCSRCSCAPLSDPNGALLRSCSSCYVSRAWSEYW